MKKQSIWMVLLLLLAGLSSNAQCDFIMNQVDQFDSTHTVATRPINIGYTVPSNFRTTDGYKMIEEGKLMFSYSESDSINSFFITLALAEREYQRIESGKDRIMFLLEDEQIVGLLNVPDRGTFDTNTNMRIYNHTLVVPIDLFYTLGALKIEKIRVNYEGFKRTIVLTQKQKEDFQNAVRCVGAALSLYPIKP